MNIINILVSSDSNFLPILGVMLHSLVTARQGINRLSIHLFCHRESLDSIMLERLEKQLSKYSNVNLYLADVSNYPEISQLHLGNGYVPATYYRLLAPILLPHLEKVLHLDCDLIINDDIAELYDTDLGNNLVAACKDTDVIGHVFAPINNYREYLNERGITEMSCYFNAGVLLMNLEKMRVEELCPQMVQYAQTHDCRLVDQDVLNYFCQGRTRYLDKVWNSHQLAKISPQARYAPNAEWKSFLAGCADEKIIHYTFTKPWNDTGIAGADIWWSYAKQTEWYEMLVQRLAQRQSRPRSVQEEIDAALGRIYDANWLRENLKELIKWNEAHTYASLVDLALERDVLRETDDGNLERLRSSRVVFYGAGHWCRCILEFFDKLGLDYPAEIWDVNAKNIGPRFYGVPLREPDFNSLGKGDLVAVTIYSDAVNTDVSGKCKNILTHNELKAALARALWLKKESEEFESFSNRSRI